MSKILWKLRPRIQLPPCRYTAPFRQSSFTGLAEAQPLQRPSSDQEVSAFHCLQSKLPEAFRTLDSELLWMLFVNACVKFATAFDEQAAFC